MLDAKDIAPAWPRSNMVRDWNTGRTEIRSSVPGGVIRRTAWGISRFIERDHRRWLRAAGAARTGASQ